MERLKIVVSIDGLQPEHDARRKPATYDRIVAAIAGHHITVHCTVTAQMLRRPSYLEEFLEFWSSREETNAVWFSLFTPQRGATNEEILSSEQRSFVVDELLRLRGLYPKLDMLEETIREFREPQIAHSVHLCGLYRNYLRRLEDQDLPPPVWRRSRLLEVRVYRFHGVGGGRTQGTAAWCSNGRAFQYF